MINFNTIKQSLALAALAVVPLLPSCGKASAGDFLPSPEQVSPAPALMVSPEGVARLLADLPITLEQVREVFDGVNASSANGYDEEYPFAQVFSCPGSGVGDDLAGTRSVKEYSRSLGSLLSDRTEGCISTRAGSFIDELAASGLQIYWPYSDRWDGMAMPVIAWYSGDGSGSSFALSREVLPDGSWIINEIRVDEPYAVSHPVWVVNLNDDARAVTPQMLEKMHPGEMSTRASSQFRTLKLREFKAHRQFDPWLSGGSEFFIKTGSLKAFTASVVSDLEQYNPEITDLMIKVKRGQVGKAVRYNAILVSEWSEQLSECAFLINEDDGGKMTTWKSSGTVKIKSRSYGFEVEIPYHRNDDIVWRGKLSSNYLTKYSGVSGRMGDVSVTFSFE